MKRALLLLLALTACDPFATPLAIQCREACGARGVDSFYATMSSNRCVCAAPVADGGVK